MIIKPSPKDIKQTYLRSLSAIGIDTKKHDIRFVEDDWAITAYVRELQRHNGIN